MEIRKATHEDINLLLENRLAFVHSIAQAELPTGFEENTADLLDKMMQDESLVCFIAVEDGKIASIAMMCVYSLLPLRTNVSGKTGYILNVYTLENYRRQGLSTKLLNKIIEEAKEKKIGKLYLTATADGEFVYSKMGFHFLDREMVLALD